MSDAVREIVKQAEFFALDMIDRAGFEVRRSRRSWNEYVPPYYIRSRVGNYDYPEHYLKVSEEFFKYFKDMCGLRALDQVLDIGCGCGHLAIPLLEYLQGDDAYEGFDIDPVLIKWSQRHIEKKYKNFHFRLADVYNKHYNPGGKQKVEEYKFPYENNAFNLAHLASVFTHMERLGMENYVREINRVLKARGRCLVSYFLLNKESRECIKEGTADYKFEYNRGRYSVIDEKFPESAVAYDEEYVKRLLVESGFKKYEIHYGSWCGRKEYTSYQDLIVAVKD